MTRHGRRRGGARRGRRSRAGEAEKPGFVQVAACVREVAAGGPYRSAMVTKGIFRKWTLQDVLSAEFVMRCARGKA